MKNKQTIFQNLQDILLNLKESPLYEYRVKNKYKPLLGEGSLDADIMFIGEALGKEEAKSGHPFMGAAGEVFDELLKTISLQRSSIFITNIINDRPPNNRTPKPEEISLYTKLFLIPLITLIQPQIIVTLGRISTKFILQLCQVQNANNSMSKLHGKVHAVKCSYGVAKILPMYHPAYALYQPGQKRVLISDIQILSQLLEKPVLGIDPLTLL